MASSKLVLVNKPHTLVNLPNNTKIVFKINQEFLDRDSNQTEALLQAHQTKAFGVIVDNCSKRYFSISGNPSVQCM